MVIKIYHEFIFFYILVFDYNLHYWIFFYLNSNSKSIREKKTMQFNTVIHMRRFSLFSLYFKFKMDFHFFQLHISHWIIFPIFLDRKIQKL